MRKRRMIVMLGFSQVGKTAICQRYCNDRFPDKYEPTYENSFRKVVKHRSNEVEIVVTDTQGQDDQEIFRKEYCLGAHGYVLVYSVDSQRSLDCCVALNEKLLSLMGTSSVPRILVANKTDLDRYRVISSETGHDVAKKMGCQFIECSAKSGGSNIDKIFSTILKEIDSVVSEEYRDSSVCGCPCLKYCISTSTELSNLKLALNVLILLTLLLGLGGIILGLAVGSRPSMTDEGDLLAYILFGFGLFTSLVSTLGLIGLYREKREYLRVFSGTCSVILVAEVGSGVFLFHSLQMLQNHSSFSLLFLIVPAVVQLAAVFLACWVQNLLDENADFSYEQLTSPSYAIV